jgi:hypothetical protein
LQKKATGLPKKIAEKVARGLGYHPQALTLAAGTLAIRKDEGYKVTAKKLLKRAKKGKGFGYLPLLDEADKLQLSKLPSSSVMIIWVNRAQKVDNSNNSFALWVSLHKRPTFRRRPLLRFGS